MLNVFHSCSSEKPRSRFNNIDLDNCKKLWQPRAIKQSLRIGIFLTRGNVQGNEALSTLGQGDGV